MMLVFISKFMCYNVTQKGFAINTTMTVRLSKDDKEIIARYAQSKGRTVSDFVRELILERIEDKFDLELYRKALAEYKKDPKSYKLDEVARLIDI